MEDSNMNIAYTFSLLMKKRGTLTQAKARKQLKTYIENVEGLISKEEFWELTEIENSIQMMDLDTFENWKNIAKQYFHTVSQ